MISKWRDRAARHRAAPARHRRERRRCGRLPSRPQPRNRKRPAVSRPDANAPVRLETAATLAFPDGSITAKALRREARNGRLAITRVAGKDFTTLAAIEDMGHYAASSPSTSPHPRIAERDCRGKVARHATWVIRDRGRKIRTGCREAEIEKARQFLAGYLIAAHAPARERGRQPDQVLIADVCPSMSRTSPDAMRDLQEAASRLGGSSTISGRSASQRSPERLAESMWRQEK